MGKRVYPMSKLSVPAVQSKVMPRRDIAQIIDSASLDEMVYFAAPFGCGKTMAVISWLREWKRGAAWLSLEEKDNSRVNFWIHLAAAVLIFAGKTETAESLLGDTRAVDEPRKICGDILFKMSRQESEKILVLDNFGFITNNALLTEVKEMVSAVLGSWRVILISRSELPPIFNDFVLKKRIRLITLSALCFSQQEVREYFQLSGIDIGGEELREICAETDGWAPALNAIVAAARNGAVRYDQVARACVNDYFETEVFSRTDPRVSEFLLKTAVLDKLTPSVCEHITGMEGSGQILRALHADGLFVIRLREREAYSYLRVFREFLLEKLLVSQFNIKELYIMAGKSLLYEEGGNMLALNNFHKGGSLQGISMALKKIGADNVGIDEYVEGTRLLVSSDVLKHPDIKNYPEVAVAIALIHFVAGNVNEMERIYDAIRGWLEPGVLTISPDEYIDFYRGLNWLKYICPDEDIHFDSDFGKWVNVTESAPHLLESSRARAAALWLPSILRGARDFSADIDGTLEFYEANNKSKEGIRDDRCKLIVEIIYAEICYEREELIEAETVIKRILPTIEHQKYTELFFSCIVVLVKIARAIHNPEEIEGLTQTLKTRIYDNGHRYLLPNFYAFELRNRLASGEAGITGEFDKWHGAYKGKPCFYLIYRNITYARALMAEKKFCEASIILGNLEYLLTQYKRCMDLIEVNILRAIAEYHLQNETGAREYLMQSLERGRKCGVYRVFSDEAVDLWQVLGLIGKRDMDVYIKKVIISCKKTLSRAGITVSRDGLGGAELTRKELAVLKLLQSGMSYEEIALDLGIKVGTVRAHLHSIYSKLNVDNKVSAIVLAQKQGII